jgi:hypothetical protein
VGVVVPVTCILHVLVYVLAEGHERERIAPQSARSGIDRFCNIRPEGIPILPGVAVQFERRRLCWRVGVTLSAFSAKWVASRTPEQRVQRL